MITFLKEKQEKRLFNSGLSEIFFTDDCPESFDHDVANSLCILVFLDVKTWDDADQVCQNYSQRLVNINTPAQVNILKEYLRSELNNSLPKSNSIQNTKILNFIKIVF